MEPDVRYTFIGVTLIALIAAAVVAIVWLTGAGSGDHYRKYEIVFVRQSLEGLQIGGDVAMRGIKIGQVVSYSLSSTDVNRVTVIIRIQRDAPVAENTVAVVNRTLVTGIARISLRTPVPAGPPLKAVDGQEYPLIKEGTSTEEQITDAASKIAESGAEALNRVNALLDKDNLEAVTAVLVNLKNITAGLDARLDRIDQTLATVNRAVDQFGRASTNIASAVDRMSLDVSPLVKQTEGTMREVGDAVKAVESQTVLLAQQLRTVSETASLDLHSTARELRITAEALDRTLNRYRDPRALIFGPSPAQLGPGEKVK
jgi:phospholipid/cholesterol/gamma-HCH transport system substrate-binding protein